MDPDQPREGEQATRKALNGVRVLNVFTDPRLGGPGKRTLAVADELSSHGVESAFLVPDGDGSLASTAQDAGYDTYQEPIPRIRSPRLLKENAAFLTTFLQTVFRLRKRIRKDGADIVHVNTPYNFQPALAASLSDASLVWHFNDTLTPPPIRQLAARAARRWADEIVVAADAVHDVYFPSSVESKTIYAPVDLSKFNPETVSPDPVRAELSVSNGDLLVGTVGNLNPIKGHEYLLRAIPQLNTRENRLSVAVVGAELESRAEYATKLRELCNELDIEDRVAFLGWRSDIPALLSALDLFVLPSVAEACPMVVLEAMSMGCPVVATDVGGVSEQIPSDDYGWVVPSKDSGALATAINEALANPEERHHKAQRAREHVARDFSLAACVQRHLATYRSALNR